MPCEKFSEKISAIMRAKRLTTIKLGELLKVNPSGVSELANGKRQPSAKQAFALARAFGVSVDYLLDDEMDRPSETPGLSDTDRMIIEAARGLRLSASQAIQAMNMNVSDSQRAVLEVFRHSGLSASHAIRLLYAATERPVGRDPIAVIDVDR